MSPGYLLRHLVVYLLIFNFKCFVDLTNPDPSTNGTSSSSSNGSSHSLGNGSSTANQQSSSQVGSSASVGHGANDTSNLTGSSSTSTSSSSQTSSSGSTDTIKPASVSIPTLSPVELKINKNNSTSEFEYADIGTYKTFTCNRGYGFNKIVNPKTAGSDEVIWQSTGNDYATKVRLRKDTSTKERQILLFLASMNYVFFHADKGKQFQNVTTKRHDFFNLKVYTLDGGVEKIAKPDQYTISLYHMSIGCTIKTEYPCSKIMYEDREVYKQDDYQDLGQLKGVYLDLVRNSMYLIGINDETRVLEAMKTAKNVTLDINKDKSADEFDFIEDYKKNVRIFKARGNAIFTKVIKTATLSSDEVIWQTSDNIYATEVFTDGLSDLKKTKNVTIQISTGNFKQFTKPNGSWVEASNFVALDITKTESSIHFDFYTKNEFKTFTAKSSFLFNKVIESKTFGSDTVIWEAPNTSDHSNKVTLMVTGTEKYMGILRTDNTVILLHKPPTSDTWDNVTSNVSKISEIKMSYYDDKKQKYFLLKPEQYKMTFNNLLHGYELKSGVTCNRVKFGSKIVWSYKDGDTFKEARAVFTYLRANNFILIGPSNDKKEISSRDLLQDDGIQEEELSETETETEASSETSSECDPTESEETDLSLSLDPSQTQSQDSTTPETSQSTSTGEQQPSDSTSTTPESQSAVPTSTASGSDSDPTSGAFME
uniref:SfiI-subtelomeric related protein family member, putative n=1 Tax=Theileria annulata TaxID=5874 RepID=A0A3B0MTG6_THEAN